MSRRPGWESPAKSVARDAQYYRIGNLFNAGDRDPEGWVVTLAGHNAAEVPLIRDYLDWDPTRVLFVDKKPAGLRAVKREWPEAKTYCGDILNALRHIDTIAFANLDFTGTANQHRASCISEVGDKLVSRGIIAYTFSRCRENQRASTFWRDIWNPAKRQASLGDKPDDIRFRGYAEWVGRLLNKGPALEVVMAMKYQSAVSMGVLLFQYMPFHLRNTSWKIEIGSSVDDGSIRNPSTVARYI